MKAKRTTERPCSPSPRNRLYAFIECVPLTYHFNRRERGSEYTDFGALGRYLNIVYVFIHNVYTVVISTKIYPSNVSSIEFLPSPSYGSFEQKTPVVPCTIQRKVSVKCLPSSDFIVSHASVRESKRAARLHVLSRGKDRSNVGPRGIHGVAT